jgi:hypothetical protein
MTEEGIAITRFIPEVQTLVNSDPTKYDPNGNGYIDDGDELSQLLSEYQCGRAEELLTQYQWGFESTKYTLAEKVEIRDAGQKAKDAASRTDRSVMLPALSVVGGVITAIVGAVICDNNIDKDGNITYKTKSSVMKKVADGSYTEGAIPAYDHGKYMKQPISEQAAQHLKYYPKMEDLNNPYRNGYSRNLKGEPFTLRKWQVGDPQFVKQTSVVQKVLPKGKAVGLVALASLAVAATGFVAEWLIENSAKNKAEDVAKTNIKARQTADGERIMKQRRAEEEALRQRQEAMKQEELEYQEKMQAATSSIDEHVTSAEAKAKKINKELDKAKSKIDEAQKDE